MKIITIIIGSDLYLIIIFPLDYNNIKNIQIPQPVNKQHHFLRVALAHEIIILQIIYPLILIQLRYHLSMNFIWKHELRSNLDLILIFIKFNNLNIMSFTLLNQLLLYENAHFFLKVIYNGYNHKLPNFLKIFLKSHIFFILFATLIK